MLGTSVDSIYRPGQVWSRLWPVSMRFTGERILPDIPELRATFLQSKAVYEFAADYVDGKCVLDCGAGEGYGPALLAERAASVVGLDYSVETVAYATGKYGTAPNLRFLHGDARQLPFRDNSFDVLCCFQVLEHLEDGPAFLFEAKRVLKPGGRLLLTTPNRLWAGTGPNPHHVLEYSADELQELLEIVFSSVEMLGVSGSPRVMQYRARNRKLVGRLIKLDYFGLRYRLPEWIREPIHASMTRIIRRFVGRKNPDEVASFTTADFPVSQDNVQRSIDLLAIATAEQNSACTS
jgi:ubiquinone/menaquinone biosynthesis C-methylase UbiE